MSEDENWGPWIEHDGKGCPCRGALVQGTHRDGRTEEWVAGRVLMFGKAFLGEHTGVTPTKYCAWSWALPENGVTPDNHVMRYRIRKPKGLTILEALLEDLPTTVDA